MVSHLIRPLQFLLLLALPALLGACKKDDDEAAAATQAQVEAQKKIDDDLIRAYVAAQNLTAVRTASGLYYVVETPAPAGAPLAVDGNLATVHYRGYLLNGTANGALFESSYRTGDPFQFRVGAGRAIAGWDEGVKLMRKGETARLIIPSYLAYGTKSPSPAIPANSVLIFYMYLQNLQ